MILKKPFDSLEWGYLLEVLNAMNFGPNFRNWIHTFYHNITSCVVNNGYASDFLSLQRGVRQGYPLSRLLFILALKPLANQIRMHNSIKGLNNGSKVTKLSLYADDTTAFICDDAMIPLQYSYSLCLKNLAPFPGKIKKTKTEGLWLWSWKSKLGNHEPFGISWLRQYVELLLG